MIPTFAKYQDLASRTSSAGLWTHLKKGDPLDLKEAILARPFFLASMEAKKGVIEWVIVEGIIDESS